ncbi:MAG: hypothetical protein QXT86_12215 [Archaeoglobaceae archaeon]
MKKKKKKVLPFKPMQKRVKQVLEKWANLLNYDFEEFLRYYRKPYRYNLPIDVRVIISKLVVALHSKKDEKARLQAKKSLELIEKEFQKINQKLKGGSNHERFKQA